MISDYWAKAFNKKPFAAFFVEDEDDEVMDSSIESLQRGQRATSNTGNLARMTPDHRYQQQHEEHQNQQRNLARTYSLFDLVCVGVGGTVGSGIFVLTGLIAREYAGPGVIFSWLIAGVACLASAMSYAELSSVIPSAGSSYAYIYVALGEYPAFIAAWCLTLEYGISAAAIARSWGDKVTSWLIATQSSSSHTNNTSFNGIVHLLSNAPIYSSSTSSININLLGGLLQAAASLLLLAGIEASKSVVNLFTIVKVSVIFLIIIGGLSLYDPSNIVSWSPNGVKGIMMGATSSFFGYVGYDEVCCIAAEAKNPRKNLPLAVFWTILIVTTLYTLASLSLVGMQNYRKIDADSGFSNAFRSRGWIWAQQIVAVGEIVTLPLGVLVSLLAQPRLQFALAQDGLLPKVFGELSAAGNMNKGIMISGLGCTLIALFVPFVYLNDVISAGVLLSFTMTNTSLLVIRYSNLGHRLQYISSPGNEHAKAPEDTRVSKEFLYHIIGFHVITIICASLLNSIDMDHADLQQQDILKIGLVLLSGLGCIVIAIRMHQMKLSLLVGKQLSDHFQVPCIPFIPLFGIFVNYYLITQISMGSLALTAAYFGCASIFYFTYGVSHSIGNNFGWSSTRSQDGSYGDHISMVTMDDQSDSSHALVTNPVLQVYQVESNFAPATVDTKRTQLRNSRSSPSSDDSFSSDQECYDVSQINSTNRTRIGKRKNRNGYSELQNLNSSTITNSCTQNK